MSSILGVVLGLGTALFESGKAITTKIGSERADPYITSVVIRLVVLVVFLAVVILSGQYFIPRDRTFWVVLVVNSIILSVVTVLFAKGYERSDISIVAPLIALYPVFVVIPAVFLLGQVPSIAAGIGLLLICAGAYTLNLNSKKYGWFEPIRKISTDKGAQFAVLGVLIGSLIPSLDTMGIESTSPVFWVFIMHVGISAVTGVIAFLLSNTSQNTVRNNITPMIVGGISTAGVWMLQSHAYLYTQASYVQAVKQASILLSVGAGYYIFNEEHIFERFSGAIIMLIGILLIVFGA